MVNYDWELKYYRGCLIAVSSKCIAYALRGIGLSWICLYCVKPFCLDLPTSLQ